jgi:hypothetical protein
MAGSVRDGEGRGKCSEGGGGRPRVGLPCCSWGKVNGGEAGESATGEAAREPLTLTTLVGFDSWRDCLGMDTLYNWVEQDGGQHAADISGAESGGDPLTGGSLCRLSMSSQACSPVETPSVLRESM